MKKLFLALLMFAGLFAIVTLEQWFMLPKEVQAQTNTFCAANLTCTVTGIWSFSNLNGVIKVDGTTYPFTNAGIQAAINAAPDGGEVDLGPGTYVLTGTGSEEILITKRLNFICSGWDSILQVGASVPGTTDIIHIKPASLVQGGRIKDCYITPASGSPGRHGISIDGTTAALSNMEIIHNRIDALGGKSIAVINATGLATGTPFTSNFWGNVTLGGWDFTNAGDSVHVENNTITGSGGFNWFPVGATVQPASNGGAHDFIFRGNNVTNTGGIWIQNGWQALIGPGNNIEIANLSNISGNAACIDIDGNSAGSIENVKVIGNFIGCSNGASSMVQVRVNRSNAAYIANNYAARSVGATFSVTANASTTEIILNRQVPSGESITVWLADSGTNTTVDYMTPASLGRLMSNSGFGPNSSSAFNHYFSGVQGRAGNVSGWCWSSLADPSSAGCDTGLSRSAAGVVCFDTSTVGNCLGNLKVAGITNNTGIQLFSTSTTCSTSGVIDNACTTGAITLPVAYADTNYRLSCTGQGPTALPIVQTYTKSNTTFTITIVALTAAVSTFSSYDCSAQHN